MEEREVWKAIIGGNPRDGSTGELFPVHEPATGEVLAEVSTCNEADVDLAVATARRAYDEDWRWRTPRERGQLLLALARLIEEHADELAELETREMGKPLEQSRQFDVRFAHGVSEYFGGLADKLVGDFIPQGPVSVYTVPEPFGVVGAVIPFNWPPIHVCGKTAPALAAGNTIVIKPAEQAPLTAIRVVELMNEVLPPGVVNVVPGFGPVGAALVGHPGLGKISFTGSTVTGRAVMRAASENLTPTILELGGKNPLIVFSDADLDLAVKGAVEGMYFNQGEACTASSRVLLHESIKDRFMERFCPAVEGLVVGDGLQASTQVGPMVTEQQQQRVLDYIRIGEEEGAKIAARGKLPEDPRLKKGYFVPPIVFDDVKNSMRIAQEEIFGPVVTVMTFQDYEEAIHMANETEFGLVAAVYTGDIARANRAAREIDAGIVFINNYNRAFLGSPFGGMKGSGNGREHGLETIREFVTTKAVRMPSGLGEIPVWSAARDV
jgi:acyl-CoA reductase-like NAD-dependent aldehyde dehydrogenase